MAAGEEGRSPVHPEAAAADCSPLSTRGLPSGIAIGVPGRPSDGRRTIVHDQCVRHPIYLVPAA
jgi:hypothetical protein